MHHINFDHFHILLTEGRIACFFSLNVTLLLLFGNKHSRSIMNQQNRIGF